ncbi:uncharacterized protein LOC143973416 [Lithobates pipiens]
MGLGAVSHVDSQVLFLKKGGVVFCFQCVVQETTACPQINLFHHPQGNRDNQAVGPSLVFNDQQRHHETHLDGLDGEGVQLQGQIQPDTPTAAMCPLRVFLLCPLRVILLCPLRVFLLCPLRVILLWALLCPGTGKVQEIFTRPGSDLLIPIRIHLTLNHTDTGRCDRIYWYYEKSHGDWEGIAEHRNCNPSDVRYFPNTRISENGSLIISNVTPENDGIYHVYIENSTGHHIQRDDYTVHVEGKVQEIFTRPGSDLLIPIRIHLTLNHTDRQRCDRIIWYYEKSPGDWKKIAQHRNCDPSDLRYFPNTRISENGSLIISNVTPENDGIYRVYIYNSTRQLIQRDDYTVHVEGKSR